MKIGILDQTCAGWSGGASYTRALLASLTLAKEYGYPPGSRGSALSANGDDQIVFLSRDGKIDVPEQFQELPFASVAWRNGANLDFDVVLPVRDKVVREIPIPKVGWIPDFQHYRLPELFSLEDLAARDALFDLIASRCQLVIVSSESSRRDFERFLPPFVDKVRVLPFPSTLWASHLTADPQSVVSSYHLPPKYALVVNQFWSHKNHAVLPPALSILEKQQIRVPLVLTGLPADYRDVENRRLSEFFQVCARLGISDQIHFLGHVPYWDMISLMRCAALVIQPSLFEGWNTTVEDAKALGRPHICSDIPVHREQTHGALGFFEPSSSEQLADLIASHYPHLDPGPAHSVERDALAQSKAHAAEFGRSVLSLAREAVHLWRPNRTISPSRDFKPISAASSRGENASWPREYLVQKRLHLEYVVGKFVFHLTYWRRNMAHLRSILLRSTLRLHGQELGILRQHRGRPIKIERFPVQRPEGLQLPSISIVTPSFNQGHTLGSTIESVLRQNYPRIEYAVVDGGSTDETREILLRYKSNLTYCVSEPDRGQADAIAKGFARLHGDIMSYLNSDDVLMPGTLSFVGEYFATHPNVDVIYGHRVIVDDHGEEVGRWILPRHDDNAIRHFDYVPQETLYWRRSIYEKVGGVNPAFQFAMDWDLLLRFIAAGARIRRVPYFLACFRIHPKQKTQTLLDTIGERERLRLLAREHPKGYNPESRQRREHWYRLRSSVCATLLKAGIRY